MPCTSTSCTRFRWRALVMVLVVALPGVGIAQVRQATPDWGASPSLASKLPVSPVARAAGRGPADAVKSETGATAQQALADAQRLHSERKLRFKISATEALSFPLTNLRDFELQ